MKKDNEEIKSRGIILEYLKDTCMSIRKYYPSNSIYYTEKYCVEHKANYGRDVEVFVVEASKNLGDCPRCRLALMCLGGHYPRYYYQDDGLFPRPSLQIIVCLVCGKILEIK